MMKSYFKWVALLLSAFIMLTVGYLTYSEQKAREEAQIEKEKMLWAQCVAFKANIYNGKNIHRCDYVNMNTIKKYKLQILLFAYEDYTGEIVTVDEIMEFLESEMDENRHSTRTCENEPCIFDYVIWAVSDYLKLGQIDMIYQDNFYDCLLEYKTANGIEEFSDPILMDLTFEELSQLREKIKNPDYELTIDLTRED